MKRYARTMVNRSMMLSRSLPILLLPAIAVVACDRTVEHQARWLTGGDPERGAMLIRSYGCASCHEIPGVPGAQGLVGPSLDGIAGRVYLAGVLRNTPENMMRWIRFPQEVDSLTAMPDMGVGERDARDIAGYLYTLREDR